MTCAQCNGTHRIPWPEAGMLQDCPCIRTPTVATPRAGTRHPDLDYGEDLPEQFRTAFEGSPWMARVFLDTYDAGQATILLYKNQSWRDVVAVRFDASHPDGQIVGRRNAYGDMTVLSAVFDKQRAALLEEILEFLWQETYGR